MLRALGEYEIGGLKTLIPFHQALLATEQWANGETCRDLVEDKDWLKQLAFPAPETAGGDEDEPEKVVARLRGRGLRPPLRRDRDRRGDRRRTARRRPARRRRRGASARAAVAAGRPASSSRRSRERC